MPNSLLLDQSSIAFDDSIALIILLPKSKLNNYYSLSGKMVNLLSLKANGLADRWSQVRTLPSPPHLTDRTTQANHLTAGLTVANLLPLISDNSVIYVLAQGDAAQAY